MITLNLISGPRNISTALMYSFAQRTDTTVVDEPFYAVYLLKSKVIHPGKDDVIKSLPRTEAEVNTWLKQTNEKPVLFVKNMAHHIEVLAQPFINNAINIFLIRNPHQIIASYSAVIEMPVMRDIGIEYQYLLFNELKNRGENPLLIDTGLLLDNPEVVLKKLCAACNIAFEQRMLHWPNGPYDGVWATHWYNNVHSSSGFKKQTTSSRPLPERLKTLHEHATVFYEKLLPFSLNA